MPATKRVRRKMVSRGCLTGYGESIADAKANLSSQIDEALEGSYDPLLVTFGENTILSWRTPNGWGYKILHGIERETGIHQIGLGSTCGANREDSIQSIAYHILDMTPHNYHSVDEIPAFLSDPEMRRDLYRQSCWQRAYRWAKENKPEGRDNDHKWHEWACWNSRNPEFS